MIARFLGHYRLGSQMFNEKLVTFCFNMHIATKFYGANRFSPESNENRGRIDLLPFYAVTLFRDSEQTSNSDTKIRVFRN